MDAIKFLKKRPELSLNQIEEKCDIPASTLSHVLSGRRGLPEKHYRKLNRFLSFYGFKEKKVSAEKAA